MKFTISSFHKRFPNEEACLAEMMRLRFGELKVCPSCNKETRWSRVKARPCYQCQWCGKQVYPMKGTPLEKTTTPLTSWFYVMYKMTSTRSGVSAMEVKRELGVTYKTAWRMCHQVRKLMGVIGTKKLKGHVEVDETYTGGKRRGGKRGRGAPGKTPVFGMVERHGEIRAQVVENVRRVTLMPIMEQNVEKGATVSSDELRSYDAVAGAGYQHGTVNHSANQYVNGEYHTQTVEGFWSRLKLSIRGTHVWVSKKHLQKYVDEFAFRYNTRSEPALMFDHLLGHLEPQL